MNARSRQFAVSCPSCGAPSGRPCRTYAGKPRPPHGARVKLERRFRAASRPSRATGARPGRQRVSVRFECPECGGPHSRAEHDASVEVAT